MVASTRYLTAELPRDEDGTAFITDRMIADDPDYLEFIRRARNSWYRDEAGQRYCLYPTVGQC